MSKTSMVATIPTVYKKRTVRKRRASICLLSILIGCAMPQQQDTWTVVSWNVQNLFDAVDNGTEYPEYDPSRGEWNENLYRLRLENIAEVLNSICPGAPDLVVFQEIENQKVLDDLVHGPLLGKGYRWRFCAPGEGAIRCGVLSRYPVSVVEAYECGFWGSRPLRTLLSFQVDAPQGPVQIFAAHWKSPRDGRAATESARRDEAQVAATLINNCLSSNPAGALMLIGDLNTPGDGLITPAALAPYNGRSEDNDALLYRTPERDCARIYDGNLILYDPNPNPQLGMEGSYWYRQHWDRPDRALLSAGITDGNNYTLAQVSCPPGPMADSEGRPRRWITEFQEGYSDHLPLFLSFETGTNQ